MDMVKAMPAVIVMFSFPVSASLTFWAQTQKSWIWRSPMEAFRQSSGIWYEHLEKNFV